MTNPLRYVGMSEDALLQAAKYDPPSAELVAALSDMIKEQQELVDSDEIIRLEDAIDDLNEEIQRLEAQLEQHGDEE